MHTDPPADPSDGPNADRPAGRPAGVAADADLPAAREPRAQQEPDSVPAQVSRTAGTAAGPVVRPPDPPSTRRRVLALVSLGVTALAVGLVLGVVLRHLFFLVGGVLGLGLVGAGGWWLVTEHARRRLIGIAALAVGVLVLGGSIVAAVTTGADALLRLGLLVALIAVAASTARGALTRDLHELDRLRSHRVRPSRPVLICNPRSGGGKVERFQLVDLANELGVEVVMLEPGSDLEQLARAAVARGADCLGMAGGDGSQALVASVATEHGLPFVCVSAGTRNHFALDLGMNKEDPREGLTAIVDGVERHVDYATVGDRLFVNNVSLGVYATIVQDEAYRDAKVATTRQQLPQLIGPEAEPFDLQFTTPEGREVDGAFLVMVSNNPYALGPGFDVAQRRAIDGGRLGVLAVTGRTGAEAGRLFSRALFGRGERDPNLHVFTAESLQVRSRSGRAAAGIDGEALDLPTPMDFRIHPSGLRLLVPPDSVRTAEMRRARGVQLRALTDIALGRAPRLNS